MKKIYQIIVVLLLSIAMPQAIIASGEAASYTDSLLTHKLDNYINAHAANNRFNGNLLIIKSDTVVYFKSFGMANRAFGVKNNDSTKFLIGSITKPFTAYGILLLEQQNKLSLDDKLALFFPDFPKASKVSIKQLLMHTAGVTDYHAVSTWKEDGKGNVTPQSTLNSIAENPFIFEPGQRFSYSNTGYILLGLIIEKLSGQSFEEFIQNEILVPLELHNTGVITNDKIVRNLAMGYTTNPRVVQKAEYINYNQPYASGNMYSTPKDLWKFAKAVMNNAMLPAHKTKEIVSSSQQYGYGWGIRNYDRVMAYGHHGGMNGFVGSMTYIPSQACFICFLTNDDNTPKYTLSDDLISIVEGKEVSPPVKTKLIDLTTQMQEAATGKYLVKPGDTLNIFNENNQLYLQETGQPRHELFPIENDTYEFALLEFKVKFSKPTNGQSDTLKFVGKSNIVATRVMGLGEE